MADEPQSIGAEVQSTEASAEEAAPAPLSLPPRVMVLKIDVKGDEHVVYVLGTAHISRESVEDARKLIRAVRPKVWTPPSPPPPPTHKNPHTTPPRTKIPTPHHPLPT